MRKRNGGSSTLGNERERGETTNLIKLRMPHRLPNAREVSPQYEGRQSDEEESEDEERDGDETTEG